ncbi:bifunctional UDP-N-acetylmuramoyl-tripeptide:D-alanyl-D-alanine ligase/alanine racemase [Pedobacter cryophilus]|uniref:Alanine racemase n=1 Tax=Pedobacter cryophilus TaxID=2571271 RepID=A0A4U1BZC9_9SPHI|nr:bifunctional UDP-N-acetylmuramoyl-tripeptide:D-alanyl-D-alanine ligase/alanine racemase [Pedobacter cryophilus]TKB97868.1 bifunctional UDP-N-acetylmuramoyl-tripeptide:D-alanyl-D-alanine ligase/alanine racemase [Pedobacter cryophilus]
MSQIAYQIQDLSKIIADKLVLPHPDQIIRHILTDSRKVSEASSSVFFALKARRDAHQYIPQLYEIGLRSFVITDENFSVANYPDANFIWVKDSLKALQQLVAYHRSHFHYPVIGITGSNGKTIVKEWLFQLLAADFKLIRSPKSYNSQIGVPLSVWEMTHDYDLAIFEAGISTVQEMDHLEEIIKPTIGILTNLASSHDEGFESRTQKLQEKLRLFKNSETLIINSKYISELSEAKKIFTWSFDQDADLKITDISTHNGNSLIKGIYKNIEIAIRIPFTDKASIENAVICWASMLYLNYHQQVIAQRIEKLLVVKMRLELKSGIHQTAIIDDSYNSDFSSLEIAIDFLNQQSQYLTKTLILSDIHQSGIPAVQLYQKVAQLVENKGIDKFIGIGEDLQKHQGNFKMNKWFFKDTDDFLERFDKQIFKNETILLKGARHFEFERISKILTQKVHDTVLEINLNALVHNLNHYKSKLAPGVKLMAMVKAFAYGSGSDEIANILQHHKVDYLAVAYADEGVALRQAGITLPIMVLSPEVSSFEALISNQLEPELYSFRILEAFADYLSDHQIESYPVHIKLDTGMHRLGFTDEDIAELISFLLSHKALQVKSALSHLAASESDVHNNYTQHQIQLFDKISNRLSEALGYTFIKHIANTAAISKWPQAQFDMVRLGIGLYGIESVIAERAALQNVATLKTTITQIKELKKGETVGYGRSGIMKKDGKIATVKIGYADGYPRALGNGVGYMLINGKRAYTIGNICMDMTMLDITGLAIKEGDDVIIFGEELSVYDLSKQLNTIPYEVITNISQRVKRVYFYE